MTRLQKLIEFLNGNPGTCGIYWTEQPMTPLSTVEFKNGSKLTFATKSNIRDMMGVLASAVEYDVFPNASELAIMESRLRVNPIYER